MYTFGVLNFLFMQSSCSSNGTVCGVDGETYPSECVAWVAGSVLADYKGPCRTLAPLSGELWKTNTVSLYLFYNHWLLNTAIVSCLRISMPPIPTHRYYFHYLKKIISLWWRYLIQPEQNLYDGPIEVTFISSTIGEFLIISCINGLYAICNRLSIDVTLVIQLVPYSWHSLNTVPKHSWCNLYVFLQVKFNVAFSVNIIDLTVLH